MDDEIRIIEEQDEVILEEAPPPNLRTGAKPFDKPTTQTSGSEKNAAMNSSGPVQQKRTDKKKPAVAVTDLLISIILILAVVIGWLLFFNAGLQKDKDSLINEEILGKIRYSLNSDNGSHEVFFYSNPSSGEQFWDFGDNSNSTERDPIHIYKEPGTYHVTLTVKRIITDNIFVPEPELLQSISPAPTHQKKPIENNNVTIQDVYISTIPTKPPLRGVHIPQP